MRFVSEDKLEIGQNYMIYYPQTKQRPVILTFIGKDADKDLVFRNEAGQQVIILCKENNVNEEEEFSPVHGMPTAQQLAYGEITVSRRTQKDIKTIRDTFKSGGKRSKRMRKRTRRGPTRV